MIVYLIDLSLRAMEAHREAVRSGDTELAKELHALGSKLAELVAKTAQKERAA
jgi:hypothetical protein